MDQSQCGSVGTRARRLPRCHVLVFLVAAPLERRMGSGRFALAALITQVAGALVGLAVASAVKLLDADWGFRLHIGPR